MAIGSLQLPSSASSTPALNLDASLSKLGDVIQQNRLDSGRKLALADLQPGPNGQPNYAGAINSLASLGDLEGATKIAAIQKSLQPENSAGLQEYNFAVKQGYKGSLLDFQKDKAQAGAPRISTTTNVSSGEKAYDSAVGKDYGEVFAGIQKAGRDSNGTIANLNLLDNLTQNPNFYSGFGGQYGTQAKKLAASLGIADPDSASANELFQKISQKAVLDSAGGSFGTGFSNADRDYLSGTVANINNTPAGNRQIIQITKQIEQRKQQIAQQARNYAKSHGGRIDAGFDDYLQDWANKNPLFPQTKSSTAQQATPQEGMTATNPKTGQKLILKNGQWTPYQ